MAGLGRKVFTAGDVLTASDVQNYLMDQSVMYFSTVAARSSAIATPSTGMVTYVGDTGSETATGATLANVPQIQAYTGAQWQNVDGLTLVAKGTIGSAVSSITITNAFSALYDNYKIILSGGVGSTNQNIGLRLGATASGYYTALVYTTFGGSVVSASNSSTNVNYVWVGGGNTAAVWGNCDIIDPFKTAYTKFTGPYTDFQAAGNIGTGSGFLPNSTSYTDFTILPGSGTLTGGTIYVYGYRSA